MASAVSTSVSAVRLKLMACVSAICFASMVAAAPANRSLPARSAIISLPTRVGRGVAFKVPGGDAVGGAGEDTVTCTSA